MEHEDIRELSFDDLLTHDDSSEKPLEHIIRTNTPQAKPLIAQPMKINTATGKPIFIHNLAQTIKTTQNGNQIISRVIKNENGTNQSTVIQMKPTIATTSANKKIIVLPAGKGQPVRVAGGTTPKNVQLVRSGNNVLTLKGQVVKVVPSSSPSTSTVTTSTAQKVIPPGAIIIKSVNQAQKPQTSGIALKQAPKNVVKLAPKPSPSSSFQIKSVTTSNVSSKQNETSAPTKYTIVRNANGQQIKIIPHSQVVPKVEVSFVVFLFFIEYLLKLASSLRQDPCLLRILNCLLQKTPSYDLVLSQKSFLIDPQHRRILEQWWNRIQTLSLWFHRLR